MFSSVVKVKQALISADPANRSFCIDVKKSANKTVHLGSNSWVFHFDGPDSFLAKKPGIQNYLDYIKAGQKS